MPDYILELILSVLQPIAAVLGTLAAAYLTVLVRTYVADLRFRAATVRAIHAVETAVGHITQSVVDDAKRNSADGRLDASDAAAALYAGKDMAMSYLGPKGVAEIKAVLGAGEDGLQDYIVGLIEARIQELKQ